jgi:Holliday junction DNA helicase RuvA
MIARLHGRVLSTTEDSLIVDVGGVGYRVRVPRSLLDEFEGSGESITLHTHLHVRENELTLYGCASEGQLALFESLLGVSGIGPRSALNIISSVDHKTLREAIAHGDAAALTRIPGIGKRTAERLITELKDRLGEGEATTAPLAALRAGDAEVIAALTALGYSVAEAQQALAGLPPAGSIPLEERIRQALRSFVRE